MRLIDADELKLSLCRECSLYPNECLEKNGECDWNSIAHINMMKPVDAMPVIRCKDCKHYHPNAKNTVMNCRNSHGLLHATENDYCSKAERKKD